MSLTLPIVVGKKYVRRDGKVITVQAPDTQFFEDTAFVGADDESKMQSPNNLVWVSVGRVSTINIDPFDLVADYTEPAKGHPHAALMAQFAEDASETDEPWKRWEMKWKAGWIPLEMIYLWKKDMDFRRKPTITPDPHAESAAEYAKDMAETNQAWQRWETKPTPNADWQPMFVHPCWHSDSQYRRKASA